MHAIRQMSWLILSIVLLASCSNEDQSAAVKESFERTLATHLDAVQNRDLVRLEPTVDDSVTLILPSGERMNSKSLFMDLHEKWFQKTNWRWEPTVLKTENSDSLGYVLLQYTYTENDSTGKANFQDKNYLALIFKRSAKGWRLIHDQNTTISK